MSIQKYTYNGPVKEFDRVLTSHWIGTTNAISEGRARSNLAHQFKESHNRTPDANITLPGKIIVE